MRLHVRFERQPREAHVDVFLFLDGRKMTTFLSDRLLAKVPRLVAPRDEERCDAIADAERPFV